MADFLQFCKQFSPLKSGAIDGLLQHVKTTTYVKGDYLLRQGDICKHLFFINEGLGKLFFYKNDKEFINRFFAENVMFTVFDSYLTQTPSNIIVKALEPVTATLISYTSMERLCREHHCMETFFRKLVSLATIKMTKRISDMLEQDATERYNSFVAENGAILQRINLGDLAKYLGITQPSLSRIRAAK